MSLTTSHLDHNRETTKSVHTFLKTPGAFGYTRAVADITPEMLADVMLKFEETGRKPSVQGLLSDVNVPSQLRKALHAMHQSPANVLGSNGHRRLLQKEGVAGETSTETSGSD